MIELCYIVASSLLASLGMPDNSKRQKTSSERLIGRAMKTSLLTASRLEIFQRSSVEATSSWLKCLYGVQSFSTSGLLLVQNTGACCPSHS